MPDDTREKLFVRNCAIETPSVSVQQRDQPAKFHAIRMRHNLFRLRRQFIGRARVEELSFVGSLLSGSR